MTQSPATLKESYSIRETELGQWSQTATVRTVDNEEQEITATVDGKQFTITEAYVRRHLQLADVEGISALPTTKFFDKLSLMGMLAIQAEEGEGSGNPSKPQPSPSTTQPIHEEQIANVVPSSHQKTQTPRQALNQVTELPQTSKPIPNVADEAVYEEWDDKVERATTTTSLDTEQASGGSPRFQEAMRGSIAQTRVLALETDLRQTKKVYGAAYTKLIMKMKKLEKTVKTSQARRRANIVVLDDEEDLEDSSKQRRMIEEINQDARVTLVTPIQSQEDQPEDYTGSGGVSTASRLFSTAEESVSNAGASMPVSTASMVQEVNKDKGKGIMTESEPEQTKTKLHSFNIKEWEDIQATIEVDEELAQRIQAEEREKYSEAKKARLLAKLINQRKRYCTQQRAEERRNKPLTQAQQRTYMSNYIKHIGSDKIVPELTTGSSKRDAEVELDHEGSKKQKTNEASGSVQEQPEEEETELPQEDLQQMMMVVPVEEVYVEALQVKYPIIDWEVYSEDTRRYWKIIRVGNHTEAYQIFAEMLKKFDKDDLDKLWDLVKERFSTTEPTDDKEKELWVELKRLFKPDNDDTLWKLQRYMHDPLVWRLYDTCGVHHVSSVRGHEIFMLVEKEYLLTRWLMTVMLANKLQVDQYSKMANELLRKIFILENKPRH
ncbi:hypothetical protein Tco_1185638 [Tanacetum coccineum]